MTTLYLSYETTSWVTRGRNPEDEWDAGSTDGTYDVTGVRLVPGWADTYETDEVIEVGDTVHVVWVQYGDGSTFGQTGGYGAIVAATKDDVAALTAEAWAEDTMEHYWSELMKWEGSEYVHLDPCTPQWPGINSDLAQANPELIYPHECR